MKKLFNFFKGIARKKVSASAIIETLMIIIVCVAICAIFKDELMTLLDGVWDTIRAAVNGLFGLT